MARESGSIIGDRYVLARPVDEDDVERWQAVDGVLRRAVIIAFTPASRGDGADRALDDDVVVLRGAARVLDGGFAGDDLYVVTPVDADDDAEPVVWSTAAPDLGSASASGATYMVHGDATAPLSLMDVAVGDETESLAFAQPAGAGAPLAAAPLFSSPAADAGGSDAGGTVLVTAPPARTGRRRTVARAGGVGLAAAAFVAVALAGTAALAGRDAPGGDPATADAEIVATSPTQPAPAPVAEPPSTAAPTSLAPPTTVRVSSPAPSSTVADTAPEATLPPTTVAPPTTAAAVVPTTRPAPATSATTASTVPRTTAPSVTSPPEPTADAEVSTLAE